MSDQEIKVDKQHSTKFSINAKGLWSGEVKCYGLTPNDSMSEACRLAKELEAIIIQKNKLEDK